MRVGWSLQKMARKRRSGSRLVMRPQESMIAGELHRRYGALASQIRAVPSQEEATTRCEFASKCTVRTLAPGPSRSVTIIPDAASLTSIEPLALDAAINDDVRS